MPCGPSRAVPASPTAVPAAATPASGDHRGGPPQPRAARPRRAGRAGPAPRPRSRPGTSPGRSAGRAGRGRGSRRRAGSCRSELVGRISAHPLVWLNPVCDDISSARNPPNAASGAANRLGNKAPTANPAAQNAATAAAPTATRHHGGAAPDALVRVDPEQDAHEDQVGPHRPDGGRGPGGELGRPARPGGGRHQVGHAAPAVPRPDPGGHARHERPEVDDGVALAHVPERPQHPDRRLGRCWAGRSRTRTARRSAAGSTASGCGAARSAAAGRRSAGPRARHAASAAAPGRRWRRS